jgi:hypothetical protein
MKQYGLDCPGNVDPFPIARALQAAKEEGSQELSTLIKSEDEVKEILRSYQMYFSDGEPCDFISTSRIPDIAKAICSRVCTDCGGKKFVSDSSFSISGYHQGKKHQVMNHKLKPCPTCQGTGRISVKKMERLSDETS